MKQFLFAIVLLSMLATVQSLLALELTPYDDARLFKQDSQTLNHYVIALGSYEKRENRWQPEKSLVVRGMLQRTTWELPSGTDEQQVNQFYQQQIPTDAERLFQCRGRDCGESNNWANDHFRIKQLYGMDEYQFYNVYRLTDGRYLTLYIVRRGNRRVYVHTEILEPANV